jgi:hypothetical protein
MGGKGGSADPSGMYAAMASAQAAQQEYQLGLQQLDWAKQVWAQEQPLVDQSEQLQIQAATADIAAQQQAQQFAAEQEQTYNQYFLPMEKQYAGQAANWASPANMALYGGQAEANVAESMGNELNTAKEQLQAYGINPDAPRYAGLYIGQNALSGAAQAGAGTTAAQNLRLQQMGLEQNALNVGAGIGNSSAQLTQTGTGAGGGAISGGSGAASTAQSNLQTGSNAYSAPTAWYNSAAQNMGVYTNAVANYNQAQVGFAQANAAESAGLGSAAGGILGDITSMFKLAKGGPVTKYNYGGMVRRYDDGGDIAGEEPLPPPDLSAPQVEAPQQAIPPAPPPQVQPMPTSGVTPGGGVPMSASPTGGAATDDVPAQLTAGEFVMPKDVSQHIGHKQLTAMVDKARNEMAQTDQRDDIGGEAVPGIPQMPPRFVSRPMHTGSTAIPLPIRGISGGIPPQRQPQYANG